MRHRLLAVVLLSGLMVAPTAAHGASAALTVTTKSATVSESRVAKVTIRCGPAKTCKGTVRLRVSGKDSAARNYDVKARKSKTYAITLTAAQLAAIPRGGSKASSVRIRETAPKKRSTRSVAITLKRAAAPKPTPTPTPTEPAGPIESRAYAERNWTPTSRDTCPASLHKKYSVIGPDGKLYPTWHPATDVDPATGKTCTYGHEHGDDPTTSNIYNWVTDFLDKDPKSSRGIPFGYVSEALDTYAADHDHVTRHEDNVGHKIIVANDVSMVGADPRSYVRDDNGKIVKCDFLIKVHQGSHSADATTNNAHEMLYAARCTDGTELISSTLTRFGDANEFNRSCDQQRVGTSGSDLPDGFGGRRLIPDRYCVDRDVLVPGNQVSSMWALYEVWESANRIQTEDGTQLASFDPWFGVRNPSRAYDDGIVGKILAVVDTIWMVDETDGGRANGHPWSEHAGHEDHLEKGDPESPFNGAQRDYYLHSTKVTNPTDTSIWWSDPYGDHAVKTAAPGLVRQLISTTDNSRWPELERLSFNLQKDYGKNNGVHAPN